MSASVRIDKGIRIYQRAGIWHLKIERGGERVRRSLDTKDRALAKEMAKNYAKRLANNESITPAAKTKTFVEYAEGFLARKERVLRKGVLANYRTAIRAATALFGKKPMGSITRSDASAFLEHILFNEEGHRRSDWTLNNYITGVQSVFADAMQEELTPGEPLVALNPFRDRKSLLERIAGGQPEIEEDEDGDAVPFDRDEQKRVLAAARRVHYPDFVASLVGLRCGLRRSEVLALRWGDLDLAAQILKVRRRLSRNEIGAPKSKASRREVPISPEMVHEFRSLRSYYLRQAMKGERNRDLPEAVFPPLREANNRTGHMDERRFGKRFAEYLKAARVEARVNKPFHRCRDTFASELLSSGTPRWLVSEWLGHTEERTTSRYGKWIPTESNVSAVDVLDSPPQNATKTPQQGS